MWTDKAQSNHHLYKVSCMQATSQVTYICHPWTYDVDIGHCYDSERKIRWPEDE